ncbi:MAG: hypothetical protein LBN27_01795 [Prevotellaceae bacterium]|nr:hypothetical protein [Prevotellaceae bacterium]
MNKLSVMLFTFSALLYSCGGESNKNVTAENAATVPEQPQTRWEYSDKTNEMDDSKTYFAAIEANEELQFDFPYSGGTNVYLTLRKGKDLDVILSISQGQFLPNIMGDRYIKVRFDDKPAENYSYSDPSDYSTTAVFINSETKFLKNLKSAKKMIIQCEFYNEGTQTIKFDTDGLIWEH